MQKFVLILIRFYQIAISPFIKSTCRFYPSCSMYAVIAIKQYGTFKGIIKTVMRILRCNPFSKGGVDFP